MKEKYRYKTKKEARGKILLIPFLILLSVAAIRFGMFAGNFAFNMDSKFIENVDTQSFKTALNRSFPIIDTIYNSGHISVSFSGGLSNLVKDVFGFEISSPLTILNAQSPFFSSYYNGDYQKTLAQRNNENEADDSTVDSNTVADNDTQPPPESNTDTSEDMEGSRDNNTVAENTGAENKTVFLEDASSITYEESDEEKEFTEENAVSSGKITIQNTSEYKISSSDLEKMLKEPLNLKFDKKGPKVLIYHTHTTESYVRNTSDIGKDDTSSFTLDAKYNVVRVGDELTQYLEKSYGIDVMHNGTIHDYPSRNGAYGKSITTIQQYLKSYPSIKLILDIHRDGLASDKPKLRVVSNIKSKNAAKLMFVIGTKSPNWKSNLQLAVKLQDKLNSQYPDFVKPIYLSPNRYNQHLGDLALLIEVGGDGNALDEALLSTKYLAKAINDVIN